MIKIIINLELNNLIDLTTLVTNKFIIHLIPTKYTTYTYLLLLTIHSHFINLIPGHIYTIDTRFAGMETRITQLEDDMSFIQRCFDPHVDSEILVIYVIVSAFSVLIFWPCILALIKTFDFGCFA